MKLTSYMQLFSSALFLLTIQFMISLRVEGQVTCSKWEGDFRDCVCGKLVRDREDNCQDESTYYQPILKQVERVCDFTCENGGTYDDLNKMCHCQPGFDGLCCQIESTSGIWGGIKLGLSGTIRSPLFELGFPYPVNDRTVWRISTDKQRRIALSVKNNSFDVQKGTSHFVCDHDRLNIYDGKTKNAMKIGSYCGTGMRKLETVYSTGEHLYIEFITDSDHKGNRGFELQYTTFLEERECGPRTVYSLETGIITSPHYPVLYKANTECAYEIQPLPDHDIVLTVEEINMKARADCSNGDRIIISKKNPSTNESETLTTFCGKNPSTIAPYTISKPSSSVFLTFTSDTKNNGVFKLRYNQVPSTVPLIDVSSS